MTSRLVRTPATKIVSAVASLAIIFVTATVSAEGDYFDGIEKALGVKGQVEEGTLVMCLPRSDVTVTIEGEIVPTGLGLESWIAWRYMGDDTVMMGDLALLEKEVNPVISALQEADINIAALHNHFAGDQPRIMFMHIEAMGKGAEIARGVKNALNKTATPLQTRAGYSQSPVQLDTRLMETVLGYSGSTWGGAFKIAVGRSGVKSYQMEMTSSMGMNSWAAFSGTNDRAHVAGDIAATATEVSRVIRALRNGGVEVVAVHNHMLDEEPRMFFVHYWGTGPVEQLAQTVRVALDEVDEPVR